MWDGLRCLSGDVGDSGESVLSHAAHGHVCLEKVISESLLFCCYCCFGFIRQDLM